MARSAVIIVTALSVMACSWFFQFNDPGGSFAGLTDDHFFYLTRGWQILYGELPVRDFVDHGAPLFYYVGWAVQTLFGRGTLSEVAFTVTMLSFGAAVTFLLATRASRSIVAGLMAAGFQILLGPRLYNYPKILVYAAAIPALWWFADRPGWKRGIPVAFVAAIGFLFRHDHGVFVGIAFLVLLILLRELSWRERVRQAIFCGLTAALLLSPYMLFIQRNGGLATYFSQASSWAERDRGRAPIVWPGLFEEGKPPARPVTPSAIVESIRRNHIAWVYYLELAIPWLVAGMLWVGRNGLRPDWPRAEAKMGTVAALGILLDAGFLRSPLEARLADPSVPLAILLAWLVTGLMTLLFSRRALRPSFERRAALVRAVALVAIGASCFVAWSAVTRDLPNRLARSALDESVDVAIGRARAVSRSLREQWQLSYWQGRSDRPDLITLSLYLNTCTAPLDHVFIQDYLPQVAALARRPFAGGHADLRPGMFDAPEAQQLTVSRLQRQRVPVMLLNADQSFRDAFPIVIAYIDQHYEVVGRHLFGGRFDLELWVPRDAVPNGTFSDLGWPCYARNGDAGAV